MNVLSLSSSAPDREHVIPLLLKVRTRESLDGKVKHGVVPPLWDGKAAERIADHLLGSSS